MAEMSNPLKWKKIEKSLKNYDSVSQFNDKITPQSPDSVTAPKTTPSVVSLSDI